MALLLRLSYIELQNAKDIKSIDLELNDAKYTVARSQERSDAFSKTFNTPLMLETEPLSFIISRRKQRCPCLSPVDPEIVTIHPNDVRSKLNGEESLHEWNKVSIKLGFLPQTQPIATSPNAGTTVLPNTSAPGNREGLRPTTEELIEQCPRFRVLVVGKSGVGKSSLINRIFGVETAKVATERPGEADIEREFISPENNRLILHDSKGFEPGDGGNYEIVKSFIEKRKKACDIKDQLHVVWLCFQIPIPTFGERLLEDAAESFLNIRSDVLGSTLTIVVFTKYDRLATFMLQRMPYDPDAASRYLEEDCIRPIQDFTGDKNITYVAVSSTLKHEHGLKELIRLTQEKISESFTSPENEVSAVPLAAAGAQRMLPTLKVDLSIGVGKQRYWQMLGSSTNFFGYRMLDCLRVIHIDIVSVWNFYDPCQYLNSENFQNLIIKMADTVDVTTESTRQLSRSGTLDGAPLLILLVPVVLTLSTFVDLGKWVYQLYQQHMQGVHTKFMAHIVDLMHVLEILFSLTAGMTAKKLTRTAIKLAYKAYYGSEWMNLTHTTISSFPCSSAARDVVLDKITSIISSADREDRVCRAIARIREIMPSVDLEKDEEWVDQESSR
ncbi:hypothetical protein EDC04DRAFT_636940 [Pisolithus marmoratus]|nr:hypothetical protein EDC04DRAFT_636940 [Pisolithus marmoratus]